MEADRNEGRIELDSGAWNWRVTDKAATDPYKVGNRPAGEGDPAPRPERGPVLVLEDPSDPEHWMARELDRALHGEEITGKSVSSLSEDADRRQVVDDQGTVWRVEKIDGPGATREDADVERPPMKVRVTSEGGPARTISMPEGRFLGQLTREELLKLVEG